MFTKIDAIPILQALILAKFKPVLIGSIANQGYSDNDIDIALPIHIIRDTSKSFSNGMILRDTKQMQNYKNALQSIGCICVISPYFAELDTWKYNNIPIDIWFISLNN